MVWRWVAFELESDRIRGRGGAVVQCTYVTCSVLSIGTNQQMVYHLDTCTHITHITYTTHKYPPHPSSPVSPPTTPP